MPGTCVLVSPYFPPSTLAGVHRARHLAKYLPAANWQPIVLCVDEAYHEQSLDPGLLSLVPRSTEIVRVKALPAGITRTAGIGDISLRAYAQLRKALWQLLASRDIGVVFITGSPYFPMLLAPGIKRRFGVSVVLDFQDPWVSSWGAQQAPFSKQGLSHKLSVVLEPRAVNAADFITSVSDRQNAEMRSRYPRLTADRMAAIPIGGDPDDFAATASFSNVPRKFPLDRTAINLSYVGTIWPAALRTFQLLLRAAARLKTRAPALYGKMRLNFVGTSRNAATATGAWLGSLAQEAGVSDVVREMPERVAYLEAMSIQTESTGVLMLGSDEPHYMASKIYSVLMSGRPFLSLFHRESTAHDVLLKAGGGIALGFSDFADLAQLEDQICDGLIRLATAPESLGTANPAAYAGYEARSIAGRYAQIFDAVGRA